MMVLESSLAIILVQISFCILPLNSLLVPVYLGPLPGWETIIL